MILLKIYAARSIQYVIKYLLMDNFQKSLKLLILLFCMRKISYATVDTYTYVYVQIDLSNFAFFFKHAHAYFPQTLSLFVLIPQHDQRISRKSISMIMLVSRTHFQHLNTYTHPLENIPI